MRLNENFFPQSEQVKFVVFGNAKKLTVFFVFFGENRTKCLV